MRITIPVTLDINFDLEVNGSMASEDQISIEAVSESVMSVLRTDIVLDALIESITEDTGWCISGFCVVEG